MKTSHFALFVALVLAAAQASAADLNVPGNLTVTGSVDSDPNTTSLGAQSIAAPTVQAPVLTYTDSATDTLKFLINRNPASWLWLRTLDVVEVLIQNLTEHRLLFAR